MCMQTICPPCCVSSLSIKLNQGKEGGQFVFSRPGAVHSLHSWMLFGEFKPFLKSSCAHVGLPYISLGLLNF